MPGLRPFRGLRYDTSGTTDLSAVICPPYDVIGTLERARLERRDRHNAVRLELPVVAGDDPDAGYAEAAHLFARWQADGTLRRDRAAMVYAYEQRYSSAAAERISRGFFCRAALDAGAAGVRGHERTMAGPKQDRYLLLRAVDANLSAVLLLWDDRQSGQLAAAQLASLTSGAPIASARDDAGVSHLLWAAEPATIPAAAALLEAAAHGPLTIADGHHRYETSLRYAADQAAAGRTDADTVLALLFEVSSGGLALLPTHRLLGQAAALPELLAAAADLFEIDRGWSAAAAPIAPGHIGLVTRDGAALLTPRAAKAGLEVSALSEALVSITGAPIERLVASGILAFTHDAADALARVAARTADAAFLLPAPPLSAVVAAARAGVPMPHKSTYFYPKPATGMVFDPLGGG